MHGVAGRKKLALYQNLHDFSVFSVFSVFTLEICKVTFSLIDPCPNFLLDTGVFASCQSSAIC